MTPNGADDEVAFGFLTDHVIHHYRLLNLELTRLHAKIFKGTPMQNGVGKVTAMTLLELNPGLKQATIAKSINKDKAAIARIVDELVREGLVKREVSPSERRSYCLTLTEKGHMEFKRYVKFAQACEAAFNAGLTEAEREQLKRLLVKLRRFHTPGMIGIKQEKSPNRRRDGKGCPA